MEALKIVLRVILLLVSLGLCVVVLMQSAKSDGMSALSGGNDMGAAANRPKDKDTVLAFWTKIGAAATFVLCVVSVILERF